MKILDLTEIPESNKSGKDQDKFELFAEEFLSKIGFKIIIGPGRGADKGRDLIVEEKAKKESIRWLVSCKHFAHSGRSVGTSIEMDLRDRVENAECHGFLGFYSTTPTSPLIDKLEDSKEKFIYRFIKSSNISDFLVSSARLRNTFLAWFPESYQRFEDLMGYNSPKKILDQYFMDQSMSWFTHTLLSIYDTYGIGFREIRSSTSFDELLAKSGHELHVFKKGEFDQIPIGPKEIKTVGDYTEHLENSIQEYVISEFDITVLKCKTWSAYHLPKEVCFIYYGHDKLVLFFTNDYLERHRKEFHVMKDLID
jgi:hypothetical protein